MIGTKILIHPKDVEAVIERLKVTGAEYEVVHRDDGAVEVRFTDTPRARHLTAEFKLPTSDWTP